MTTTNKTGTGYILPNDQFSHDERARKEAEAKAWAEAELNKRHRAEILSQAEAFKRLQGDMLGLIDRYAADFRRIINEYEAATNRVPTADDLIWLESERKGCDITKI